MKKSRAEIVVADLPASASANVAMVCRIAERLGVVLCSQVVFVGGATTALLLTDPAALEVRPTRDVDVIVEIAGYGEYTRLSEDLRSLGFCEDVAGVICRWTVDDLVVDLMPTDPGILGFTNRWYSVAMRDAAFITLNNGKEMIVIRILPAPLFLATKLEAFSDRGKNDYYASHDFEDMITLIDGRQELVEEIGNQSDEVRIYLCNALREWLKMPAFSEIIEAHLTDQTRLNIVLSRIRRIAMNNK